MLPIHLSKLVWYIVTHYLLDLKKCHLWTFCNCYLWLTGAISAIQTMHKRSTQKEILQTNLSSREGYASQINGLTG